MLRGSLLLGALTLPALTVFACGGQIGEDSPEDGGAGFAGAFGSGGVANDGIIGAGGAASGGGFASGGTSATGGAGPGGSGGLASGGSGGRSTGGSMGTGGEVDWLPGTECGTSGEVRCAGAAHPLFVVCDDGTWQESGTCPSGELCDRTSGECEEIAAGCADKDPGEAICESDSSLYECGPDLVTKQLAQECSFCNDYPKAYCYCPPGTFSDDSEHSSCSPCPEGTFSDQDNAESCTPWDPCPTSLLVSPGTAKKNVVCGDAFWDVGDGSLAVHDLAAPHAGGVILAGAVAAGLFTTDGFVEWRGQMGEFVWTRQFGTTSSDAARAVALDASDSAYVGGVTYGGFDGPSAGEGDAFLRKYDPGGGEEWTRQFGGLGVDSIDAIAVDSFGLVYVAGSVDSLGAEDVAPGDVLLRQYDGDGDVQWTRNFGTSSTDAALGVAVTPSGDVYVAGFTQGHLGGTHGGGSDAFLSKYDADGVVQWIRQLGGTGDQSAHEVVVDGDEAVYLVVRDATAAPFAIKYDAEGNEEWTIPIAASADDLATELALDWDGHIYVAGSTSDRLGTASVSSTDVFVRKYDSSGDELWTRILDLGGADTLTALTVDSLGQAVVAGSTDPPLPSGGYAYVLEVVPP